MKPRDRPVACDRAGGGGSRATNGAVAARRARVGAAVSLCVFAVASPAHGAPLGPAAGSGVALQPFDDDLASELVALRWRPIGPATMGGRIADIAAVDSETFFVGVATGNLWKTTNRGTTWEALFEDEEVNSIGDVAVAPSSPDIVWISTGEANNRQSSPWGAGVFKSIDGGQTWTHMGLASTRHIGRIIVHPRNPAIVYVAALGSLWGASEDRGVFRTTDSGRSWQKILYVDEDTGATDLVIDPQNSDTLLAAMYQRRRSACCFVGGGPGSGIYRSTDGGDTWTELSEGLPAGDLGRIGLDAYRRDGQIVLATVEAAAPDAGVYRSSDGGDTWEQLNDFNPRPMYFSQIRVDPNDAQRVYVLGGRLHVSDDGGRSFRDSDNVAEGVHPDLHALWIDPSDSDNLILGHDGGVLLSFDRAVSWLFLRDLPIGQFYEIGVDMRDPYRVYGGLQDNGVWGGPSRSRDPRGSGNGDWVKLMSGDGFYARIAAHDPDVIFTETQNGALYRFNLRTMERQSIRPSVPPETVAGVSDADQDRATRQLGRQQREAEQRQARDPYRWNWDTPFILSSHAPATLYSGANHLLRSTDGGSSWEAISPDLSKQIDRESQALMGVRPVAGVLSLNDGICSYGNLTTIAESPLDPGVIYAGSDDGNVQRTVDGGATWTDLTETFAGLPEFTSSSRLLASRFARGRVYATFDGHYQDDFKPYVYLSDDHGDTWRPIVSGLPDWSVNVIAEHHRNQDLLFLGTELGIYVSVDRGSSWSRLKNNLPTVPVDDIVVHPRDNDLVIGTHGRSIWILDDIAPLEKLVEARTAAGPYLFPARQAELFNVLARRIYAGAEFRAPNPPFGALIRYRLDQDEAPSSSDGGPGHARPAAVSPTVELEIVNAEGDVLRELIGPGTVGIHEVVWDLRMEPPFVAEEREDFGFSGPPGGPRVLPGDYQVRLRATQRDLVTSVSVRLAEGIDVPMADLQARQRLLLDARDLSRPIYQAGRALRQIERLIEHVHEISEVEETGAVTARLESVAERLSSLEKELDKQRGLFSLVSRIEESTTRPTRDQVWSLDLARREVPALVGRLNSLINDELPTLYRQLETVGVQGHRVSPVDPAGGGIERPGHR